MGVKLHERPGKGWYVFTDWNGQRMAKFFGKNKALAKAFADKLAAKLKWAEQSGEAVTLATPDGTIPTVEAYLTEWLTVYAEAHCKASTAEGNRQVVRQHILPALGSRRLCDVTRIDLKRLIAALAAQGRKKRTIHNILTPLKEAYQHAIDDGLVTTNPVTHLGRMTSTRESADSHIDPLTTDEVRALLSVAQDRWRRYYPLLLCAVRTGLRQGELIGLQWSDVDFAGQFLEVRRAVVRRRETTTKTHKIRHVDLSPQLARVLQALKEARQLEALLTDRPMPDWIFLSPAGHRMTNELIQKSFYACLDAAGLRHVRFHDLRHTFASLHIHQGTNVKYIQQQLGHGSISITLDVYSPLFHGDHRHHVSRLDDPQEDLVTGGAPARESATQAQPQAAGVTRTASEGADNAQDLEDGGVTERPNVPVLKTGDLARGPRVRISPPPPTTGVGSLFQSAFTSTS
jgi:integrase